MNIYRPRFEQNAEKWRGIIDYIREIGIDEAYNLLTPKGGQVTRTETTNSGISYEYKGEKPITSLSEAVEFFEIDLQKWDVDRWVSNAWDVSMKDAEGKAIKRTNYQVKVWLKTKGVDWGAFKDELRQAILRVDLPAPAKVNSQLALEINIADLHIGKVGFDVETLSHNWTIEEAGKVYRQVIADALEKAGPVDHFILPVGNDLLNINSGKNQTVAGTPQMTTQFFQNLFLFTRRLVAESIITLGEIAPVFVYMVPGNHDGEAIFTLGEALSAQFENVDHVTIDNTPILRKYHKWGKNLIGFSHGDKINARDLHNAMSNDRPRDFGEAKYRYFHTGHLHKNAKKRKLDLTLKDEYHGVEVEICPSLSPTDEWHYQNLYTGNMRRSKSFVYDKNKGKIAEFYLNL